MYIFHDESVVQFDEHQKKIAAIFFDISALK